MDTPLLWHIPLSHFSEKVRWALDYKGIAHRRGVLGPNYLVRVWRATGQGKLPVLWLDGRAIADSTRIIAALEAHYPEPPLYPCDTATRQRALALEDDLDETLGPALRAAIVTPLFRNDPDIALRVLTTGMGDKAYRTLRPPHEIQYPLQVELPLYLKDYRATLFRHPAAQWAAGIYRLHRGYSSEVANRTIAP